MKAKTDLLTQFNYELKTPINSILDYGEMIRSEIEKLGETSLLESFKNMQTTGRHLLKLIQGMQSSAQTNWQALGPQPQTFKVKEVLEGILVTLFPMARKNNNKMELKQGPDLGSMVSDELRVRQILLNIIVNACEFTENGKILIETMVENVAGEEWICFRISDTGAGMDPEKARNLFREGSAIQTQSIPFGGTGMGLPFSKRLCAMLGGNIQVKSEVNKGSVFSVRLPRDIQSFIAKQRRNPITPEVKTPTSTYQVLPGSIEEKDPSIKISGSAEVDADESLKKKEICVVDENFDNSNILCHILKGQGWSARPLELSKSTLDKLDREIPDMIIICLGVAGDQGLQLISELGKRESMKSIPILIFSARELGDDEKSMLEGRVQGMMHKGNCTRQELIDQIKSLLRNKSSK
ncbi:MAG: hybrid sensor histidine kinase/response regulator [Nitrospinae bacterium]|nr:hybrid sensor histidine kinase/response regulator [Nitrospinota bacterium]